MKDTIKWAEVFLAMDRGNPLTNQYKWNGPARVGELLYKMITRFLLRFLLTGTAAELWDAHGPWQQLLPRKTQAFKRRLEAQGSDADAIQRNVKGDHYQRLREVIHIVGYCWWRFLGYNIQPRLLIVSVDCFKLEISLSDWNCAATRFVLLVIYLVGFLLVKWCHYYHQYWLLLVISM